MHLHIQRTMYNESVVDMVLDRFESSCAADSDAKAPSQSKGAKPQSERARPQEELVIWQGATGNRSAVPKADSLDSSIVVEAMACSSEVSVAIEERDPVELRAIKEGEHQLRRQKPMRQQRRR